MPGMTGWVHARVANIGGYETTRLSLCIRSAVIELRHAYAGCERFYGSV